MPTTIDQLDDLCLLLIFDELSICDLFRAGRVCVWWNAIRSKSANGRKELTLLIGSGAQRFIDEALFRIPERGKLVDENGDALIPLKSDAPFQVESLSVDLSRFLYENLPNLTTLTISWHYFDEDLHQDDSVTCLLKHFASTGKLQTLKLFTDGSMNQPLRNALNSIATLKKLHLNLKNGCFSEKFDLPILGQLEEFDFYAHKFFGFQAFKNLIMRYAVENTKLKKICIDFSTLKYDWMLSLPREFASRFTHLHIYLNDPFDFVARFSRIKDNPFVRHFDEMSRHFHNLTSLELTKDKGIHSLTPTELFTPLSHLHNLLSLTIDTIVMDAIPSVVELENNQNIPTLPSVRILIFKIEEIDHENFSNRNFSHFFPNIETVKLIRTSQLECEDCYFECNLKFHKLYKLPVSFSLMFCTLRMIGNLIKCQQLKRVCAKLGNSFLEWPIKKLKYFVENANDYFSKDLNENSSKNKDKDVYDFESMKNLYSDFVKSEYEVAGLEN